MSVRKYFRCHQNLQYHLRRDSEKGERCNFLIPLISFIILYGSVIILYDHKYTFYQRGRTYNYLILK